MSSVRSKFSKKRYFDARSATRLIDAGRYSIPGIMTRTHQCFESVFRLHAANFLHGNSSMHFPRDNLTSYAKEWVSARKLAERLERCIECDERSRMRMEDPANGEMHTAPEPVSANLKIQTQPAAQIKRSYGRYF